jgi:hypothetical protein
MDDAGNVASKVDIAGGVYLDGRKKKRGVLEGESQETSVGTATRAPGG